MRSQITQEQPELTIGLPVRNGGKLLELAITSLLNQTFRNFVLIISDNELDDQTQATCERFAKLDSRIRYVRQPTNLGHPGNFRFTLTEAQSPFFMWAAHDDIWLPTFAEQNIDLLKRNPAASASVSRVEFMAANGQALASTGTASIIGLPAQRVRSYLQMVGDSSRFYSVYRTDVLKRCFPPDTDVYGFDWLVSALVLAEGDNLEVNEVLLRRTPQATDHYFRSLLNELEISWLDRQLPFRRLTLRLRKYLPPDVWRACRVPLLRYNVIVCLKLLEYRFPLAGPLVAAIAEAEKALRKQFRPVT